MPWTMKVVFWSIRMLMSGLVGRLPVAVRRALDLLDCAARSFVHRHRAVAVLDAVLLQDLEALVLPGAGDAEDRDLLRRVETQLETSLHDPAGDDVDARVRDDAHHHGDLVDAGLGQHE